MLAQQEQRRPHEWNHQTVFVPPSLLHFDWNNTSQFHPWDPPMSRVSSDICTTQGQPLVGHGRSIVWGGRERNKFEHGRVHRCLPHRNASPITTIIPVGHEPRSLQLSHIRIDEGVARLSRLPGLKRTDVRTPLLPFCIMPRPSKIKDGIAVLGCAVSEKVPPQELKDQPVGGVICDSLFLVFSDLHVQERQGQINRARRNIAEALT